MSVRGNVSLCCGTSQSLQLHVVCCIPLKSLNVSPQLQRVLVPCVPFHIILSWFSPASHYTYDPACLVFLAFVYDRDFIETMSYTSAAFEIALNSFDPGVISTWQLRLQRRLGQWVFWGFSSERKVHKFLSLELPPELPVFVSSWLLAWRVVNSLSPLAFLLL